MKTYYTHKKRKSVCCEDITSSYHTLLIKLNYVN